MIVDQIKNSKSMNTDKILVEDQAESFTIPMNDNTTRQVTVAVSSEISMFAPSSQIEMCVEISAPSFAHKL